jgi:tetratricopeptide (TPR) repeat protein
MEIHILLAGVQIGPFSEKQVREYLVDGLVSPTDMAKYDGMRDWETVKIVLANLPPPQPVATVLSPTPEPPPPTPAAIPDRTQPMASPAPQKARRKPGPIVLQPILPLTATPPGKTREQPPATPLAVQRPAAPVSRPPPLPQVSIPAPAPAKAAPAKSLASSSLLPLLIKLSEKIEPETRRPPAVIVTPSRPPELPRRRRRTIDTPGYSLFERLQPYAIYGFILAGVLLMAFPIYWFNFRQVEPAKPAQPPGPDATVKIPAASQDQPDEKILSSNPQTSENFSNRGAARQNRGDLDGAIADYNQAINLDPRNKTSYYRRGVARQAKGDWDGALADFNQDLSLDPQNADAYSFRAFVKQSKGDLDGAIADYTQALFINPNMAKVYYNRGLIKVQRGDLDGAIIDYNHALDLDPKMAVAYFNRGDVKNAEGNLDGAIADYTQTLSLNPKIAIAYCHRGLALESKGDMDGALDDYSQALVLDPKMITAYDHRSLIEEQKNNLDGAIADSTQALGLNPKDPASYCNRGLARLGTGDLDGALSDLRNFIALAPTDGDADYARLYIWLIVTRQNPKAHADQELSDSILNDWNSPPEDLASRIARFLLGHLSENDLIASASSADPIQDQGQHCKVWYFAGMKQLLDGNKATAIDYFRKALGTEKKDFCEYIFAQAELKALGQDPQTDSK